MLNNESKTFSTCQFFIQFAGVPLRANDLKYLRPNNM